MRLFFLPIVSLFFLGCPEKNKSNFPNKQIYFEDSILSTTSYPNGAIKSISLNKSKIKGNVLNITYYPNGKIESQSIVKDSLIINKTDSPLCTELYLSYYSNGKLKEKGCQGFYNSMGVTVGTWFEYDSLEHLVKTIYYHPDNYGNDYKIVKIYDKEGGILTKEIFNNNIQYETEERKLNKIPK